MLARLTRTLAFAILGTCVAAAAASAQEAKKQSANVAGKWTLSVDTGAQHHGTMEMGLTLKQEGTHVTGTFASPHGDMPVDGEFYEGSLKLSTTGGNADSQITFEAKLKEDDSLDGYVSSQMGDMKWTGKRLKDKQ
jgi:hypothetical protein